MKYQITCDNCGTQFIVEAGEGQVIECQCPHCKGIIEVTLPIVSGTVPTDEQPFEQPNDNIQEIIERHIAESRQPNHTHRSHYWLARHRTRNRCLLPLAASEPYRTRSNTYNGRHHSIRNGTGTHNGNTHRHGGYTELST